MHLKPIFNGFLVLGSALLFGCQSISDLKTDISERVFGREELNPPAALVEFKPTANPKILWSNKIGGSGSFDFSPAADSTHAYAASAEGQLLKIDAKTGKEEWRINTGENLSAGVGIGSNLVLVGTSAGYVVAYDQKGKLLWKSKLSSEILSAPRVNGNVVIVRAGDGRIFGLNAMDGARVWVYERTTPALTLRSSAGITISEGVVYAGYAGGKLVAVKADDGKTLWEATVAQPKGTTEIERIADITSLPVVDGPIVFAVAYQGKVAAIDRDSGRVGWSRDISSYTGINAESGRLYLTHAQGAIYSLEYTTGKTFWRQGDLRYRQLSAPSPMGDLIAVGDLQGYVHFLQREDGAFAARVKTDDSAVMPQMTELDLGVVLAQTRNGGLYAIATQ
ncbi:MAG: outer membrane protein assembly factor BamB [Methylophilaceae bacterium]|nr:outer membrane protein assembly factor BamB [Methylophilaceae bacterium]